ncbi:TPA: hypothetical protein HA241_00945 [Candidatus Woesearchaeota archaeon]|nr:hypothetical protein [Candidatus Woesearchaeota archaeon]
MKTGKKTKKRSGSRKSGAKPKAKTAQPKIYKTRRWGQLVVLALVVMIVTIILDVFYMDFVNANNLQPMIDAIDVPVTLVLFSDVAMRFKDSRDKKKFVKRNMILIFSVLPISFALIGFRFLKLFPVITELPLLSELIALEKVVKVQHGAKFLEALKSFVRIG